MATDHQSIILDFIRKETGPFGYKELNMHYMQFMVQLLNIVTHLRYITCKNHCLLVQLCWEYQIKCLLNGKNKSICRYEYNGFNPTTRRYLNFDGLIHCCWASHMSFSVRALESPITVSVAPTYKIPIDAYNRRIGGNCQILMTIVCAERERERGREANHSFNKGQSQWMFQHQTPSNIECNSLFNLSVTHHQQRDYYL